MLRRADGTAPQGDAKAQRLARAARTGLSLTGLNRLTGIWLLLLPGWWSLALAARGEPRGGNMLLFLAATVLVHAAGASFSGVLARRDNGTEMTWTPRAAVAILALALAGYLAVMLRLDGLSRNLGFSWPVLMLMSPVLRRAHAAAAWNAMVTAWGVLFAWAIARDSLSDDTLLLCAGAGLLSFGGNLMHRAMNPQRPIAARLAVAACYVGGFGVLAAAAWPLMTGPWPQALLAAAGLHLLWQATTLKPGVGRNLERRYRSNREFGLLVLAALVVTDLAWRVPNWIRAELDGKRPPCVRYVHDMSKVVCPDR